MKYFNVKFTKTEIEQLLAYCDSRGAEEWYWKPREAFEARHKRICAVLVASLKEAGFTPGDKTYHGEP